MSKMQVQSSRFNGIAIVRDRLGRVVMDESIFHNKEKLELFRQEIVKNGSHAFGGNPKRDC
jgi:hypothetical protein